jgi:dihydroorotase
MARLLIKNATVVNEGNSYVGDVLCVNGIIERIEKNGISQEADKIINAQGLHLLPGVIDDQVHFREPGFTHKANIATESRAAVAGGVTTFMEMPNTNPQATTIEELEKKYVIANQCSPANYSFFLGATNDNIEEVKKADIKNICGIKIFMGSSTGNMLVDKEEALDKIFKYSPMLIATHCEDEDIVRANLVAAKEKYGENVPFDQHPIIRSREACIKSSKMAIDLATKHNSRLHILHISTEEETYLFRNDIPLKDKKITSEVCVHHLWFANKDYEKWGSKIKCNPAIKMQSDKDALLKALLDNRLDIIATDHAPHTLEEKHQTYFKSPSGLPLIQHTLLAMLDFVNQGKLSIEFMVEKMSHTPAICFQVEKRGFIKEGYFADLVLVDLNKKHLVNKDNLQYKCEWSPFEGHIFPASVEKTIVNGEIVYEDGIVFNKNAGKRISFVR